MAVSLPKPESRKMAASRMRPSRMVVELLDAMPAPAAEVLMDMVALRKGLMSRQIDQADCSPKPPVRRHIVHRTYISGSFDRRKILVAASSGGSKLSRHKFGFLVDAIPKKRAA